MAFEIRRDCVNFLELAAAFELPEHIRPVAVLTMGYAAEDAKPYKKMHNVYRPMEEMVEELQV